MCVNTRHFCIYIYIYIFIYICICICIYIYIYICICIYIYIYTYVCVYIYMYKLLTSDIYHISYIHISYTIYQISDRSAIHLRRHFSDHRRRHDAHTFWQITCDERSCEALQITCQLRAWRYSTSTREIPILQCRRLPFRGLGCVRWVEEGWGLVGVLILWQTSQRRWFYLLGFWGGWGGRGGFRV